MTIYNKIVLDSEFNRYYRNRLFLIAEEIKNKSPKKYGFSRFYTVSDAMSDFKNKQYFAGGFLRKG